MELTKDLIEHMKDLEGLELEAYRDVNNVLTIGYGHTNAAGSFRFKDGDKITAEKALEILEEDLNEAEGYVEQMLKNKNLDIKSQPKKDYMTLVYFNRPWALRDTMDIMAADNFDAIRPSQLDSYKDFRNKEAPDWFQDRVTKELAYVNEFDDPTETGGNATDTKKPIAIYLEGKPQLVDPNVADMIVQNTDYTYEPTGVSNLRREQSKYQARIKIKRLGDLFNREVNPGE